MPCTIRFKIFFLLGLMFCPLFSTNAQEASTPNSWAEWTEAKNQYDLKRYDESFAQLLSHPRETGNYYYNLGTVSYRLGKSGQALAYLEKAYRLSPNDADIQYNLSIARQALATQMGQSQLDPSSSWWEKLADRVTLEQARATLGLMGLIMVLLWMRTYFGSRSLRKTLLNTACLISLSAFVITLCVYSIQRFAEGTPPAICLEKDSIRSGPGSQYMELAKIEAGTKVRYLGSGTEEPNTNSGGKIGETAPVKNEVEKTPVYWIQVRYSPEGIGWIRASSLLTL